MRSVRKGKSRQLTASQKLIKNLLKTSEHSLYQIAKELNIQPTHLKKIMNGEIKRPRLKTFQKLIKNKYTN